MRRTCFSFVSWTSSIRSNIRFTRAALRRRKWLFIPFARMSFPVAVTLKRRFAPLWVFSFCFVTALPALPLLWRLLLLQRIDHHDHCAPLHVRGLFDRSVWSQHVR